MRVFWSDLAEAEIYRPRRPGRSDAPGSGFAWSLLEFAIRQIWDRELPAVSVTPGGKPYFPSSPELCFSLSHTRTAVLAVVSAHPVGGDVEAHRPVRPSLERCLYSVPHGDLDLFSLWTLRESWFKLTGEGDLRTIPFSRSGGIITGPAPELHSRLYDSIPGCTAAVCSFHELPPEQITQVELPLIAERISK